ncbi:MAG: tryptophan synthase subunit alpha [Opitutales bacterium]
MADASPDSSRIARCFARCRSEGRAAFVAYVCAGDPDAATSLQLCQELLAAGVDILELGVPFSDPLADGLTNQLAAQRALESGATHDSVFDQVTQLRRDFPDTPIVFYTYYNLVYSQGTEAYCRRAAEAGVDALLCLDLPPEEGDDYLAACRNATLRTVFIVAPTTHEDRLPAITGATTGFVYYVSRAGVTGVRDDLATDIGEAVQRIKQHTELPVVVGFGISSPEQVRAVVTAADGVVVGSALVNCVKEHADKPREAVKAIGAKARELIGGLSQTRLKPGLRPSPPDL